MHVPETGTIKPCPHWRQFVAQNGDSRRIRRLVASVGRALIDSCFFLVFLRVSMSCLSAIWHRIRLVPDFGAD